MSIEAAKEILKKYFGYDRFRPLQSKVIEHVLEGQDSLVLMPTGGGKSMCFQVPAILLPGTCVVVSPLISLMKDQVEGLRTNGVKAAFINSSLSAAEQHQVENDFFNDELDLLYVSPEKMTSQSFLPLLKRAKVNLFAIDEAHCISSWGHDFRQEYTQMRFLKQQFPDTPIIALTATADKITRQDILQQLDMTSAKTFLASFDRPNLSLEVRPGQKRFEQILTFINERTNTSGIIYCLSRRSTEDLAEKLQNAGHKAAAYHAGLSPRQRSEVQEKFINDQTPIVCATIAFGMGIDKSNVRWIIHYNLPKNMEGYYQEIGRAGRDGVAADTLLFYSFKDVMMLRDILGKEPSTQTDLQLAKLERMQQYAESLVCRRRILLSYFGESLKKDCGNCDVCRNPPTYVDGTVLAQKALSAIYRLRQSEPMGTVIDVLRGSGRKEIRDKGYQSLKTFGVGRDIKTVSWQHYMAQLVQLGLVEIAYNQKNALKLTEASKGVLFEKQPVKLVQFNTIKERQEAEKNQVRKRTSAAGKQDELFQKLREVRRNLARDFGVPPYQVFSDATLLDMVKKKPMNDREMSQVSGVGERKLYRYGDFFIDAILDHLSEKRGQKGSTYKLTHEMLKQGHSIEEIASRRSLNPATVYSHVAYLYEKGEPVDLSNYVSQKEVDTIIQAVPYVEKPIKLKSIYEYFDQEYDYHKIRLALAYYNRNMKKVKPEN